jgi:hypothetical protein
MIIADLNRLLSIKSFSSGAWSEDILRGKIRDDILSWVTNERDAGRYISDIVALLTRLADKCSPNDMLRPTVTSVTALAKLLDTFSTLSEPYVSLTNSHYSERAETNIISVESGTMSASKYVEWVQAKVTEERERACLCMDPSVAKQVVHVVRVQSGYKMSKRIVRRGRSPPPIISEDHWLIPRFSSRRSDGPI